MRDFNGAAKFNKNLDDWDTSEVTEMLQTFLDNSLNSTMVKLLWFLTH